MMRALLALALLAPAIAAAVPIPPGGGWLRYELEGLHANDRDTASSAPRQLVLAGVRLHAFVGTRLLGFQTGFDLAAGGTIHDGGLAYDVSLFPAGVALRLGTAGFVSVGAGLGASGATGVLDDAMTIPIDATFELGTARVRLLARARGTFVFHADARQDGARTWQAFDELEGMIGLRLGKTQHAWGLRSGNGYFVGASFRELMGGRMVGLVIGHSIDATTAPRRARRIYSIVDEGFGRTRP